MSFDPDTVTADELEPPTPHSAPHRVVGRYPRAVVVETDQAEGSMRFTVYALVDADTGPYERPHVFRGVSEQWAHDMASEWTRLP
jgi:hypothetical protein